MNPLALAASVKSIEGTDSATRRIIRMADIRKVAPSQNDAALIESNDDLQLAIEAGWKTLICKDSVNASPTSKYANCIVSLNASAQYLKAGDVISLDPMRKRFRTLFRVESKHNSFLVTERCNHLCLMCSQPPKDQDDSWMLDEIEECLPLLPRDVESIGFTGGEPLTEWSRFVNIIRKSRECLPNARLHVLSNGRYFAMPTIAKAWSELDDKNLCVGIPIYSCVDHVHDHVVQSKGALDETILGILRLKDHGQRVEIRLVLHALTIPTLVETCRWFARSLPFVDHIALMGLENTGYAIANAETLWIDPLDYSAQLSEAIDVLTAARVPVSIYNLPKCVLPRHCWRYAAMSISDWKNAFLPQCEQCSERHNCSGFFSTGRPRYSRGVIPILVGEEA